MRVGVVTRRRVKACVLCYEGTAELLEKRLQRSVHWRGLIRTFATVEEKFDDPSCEVLCALLTGIGRWGVAVHHVTMIAFDGTCAAWPGLVVGAVVVKMHPFLCIYTVSSSG